MGTDETYMFRCLELARLGAAYTAPNPMVGALLVHDGRIIGEGYHQRYGGPHAEVHCINSVAEADRPLITSSTLYVSLEPCAHFGKTPPCADLIIAHRIPRVVVGCRDPFAEVNGKGIEKLQRAGIVVTTGVLEQECLQVNRRFFTFHTQHRPFILLKWAQTANGYIAAGSNERLLITNSITNRLVHRWRSENMGILVGTQTALLDDPELTNRLWSGPSPLRLVVDLHLRLPAQSRLLQPGPPVVVFNAHRHSGNFRLYHHDTATPAVHYYQVTEDVSLVHQVCNACVQLGIQSVLVEGGARLLQSFIDDGCWDEARVITNEQLYVQQGLPAPRLGGFRLQHTDRLMNDRIDYFAPSR